MTTIKKIKGVQCRALSKGTVLEYGDFWFDGVCVLNGVGKFGNKVLSGDEGMFFRPIKSNPTPKPKAIKPVKARKVWMSNLIFQEPSKFMESYTISAKAVYDFLPVLITEIRPLSKSKGRK